MFKKTMGIIVLSVFATVCAACSKTGTEATPTHVPQSGGEQLKPVTITMYQYNGNITDEEFRLLMAEPVKQKYPHITMEIIRPQTGISLQEALFMGDIPDLIFPGSNISEIIRMEAVRDLAPLVSKHQFELGSMEMEVLEGIKNQAAQGQLYALPFSVNFSALFYNKDIFDKFGVAYPKERMTWDEAIELAKRVARTEGGVSYQPLNPGGFAFFLQPTEQALVDPITHKAKLSTERIAHALKLYKAIIDLPGNQLTNVRNAFLKERTAAMVVDRGAVIGELDALYKKGDDFQWDITTVPTFKEYPEIGHQNSPFLIALHSQSKQADDAFLALSVILSNENQLKVTRSGRLSALKDTKYKTSFGEDLESLKGKNIPAAFRYKSAVSPRASEYVSLASAPLNEATKKAIEGAEDINTALLKADEQANLAIDAELAAKK